MAMKRRREARERCVSSRIQSEKKNPAAIAGFLNSCLSLLAHATLFRNLDFMRSLLGTFTSLTSPNFSMHLMMM